MLGALYTKTKKKRRVNYKNSFKRYNVKLHHIHETISIGYLAFHFRPSNREQDINLNDFHYSRPSNKIIRMHILCTHRFLFVLVYLYTACNVIKPCIHMHHAFCMSFLWTACRYLCRFIKLFVNVL